MSSCTSPHGCQSFLTSHAVLMTYLYEGLAYNVVFLGQILPAVGKEDYVVPFFVAFNISLGVALWSYYAASISDPGRIPKRWQEFVSSVGELLSIVPPRLEWQVGKATYCHLCGMARPERAHHCKVCGHCVLRMDHHCPWLNNCVGFHNHKFFTLAVGYGLFTSFIAFFTALPELVACVGELAGVGPKDNLPQGGQLNMESPYIWVFMVFGVFALVLLPLLGAMFFAHIKLIGRNTTTIEGHFSDMDNPFDQGSAMANLTQIFGDFGFDWFLPVAPWNPKCDGVSFERTDQVYSMEVRRVLSCKDTPPEKIWRARYHIGSEQLGLEVIDEPDPNFMAGIMSWWQGSTDQDALLESGEAQKPKRSKVVPL